MTDVDIRAAAAPKSDQLNADDLTATTMNITVTAVKSGNKEQPIVIHYEGENGRPYKPCKSMMRVLMTAWGDKGLDWVGKSMTLFSDPTVRWAGVEVGGIRISHVSDIKTSMGMSLTASKGKRKPFRVDPLIIEASTPTPYPAEQFNERLPAMVGAIVDGKMTLEQVITRLEKTGTLTQEQIDSLTPTKPTTPTTPTEEKF